MKAKASLLENHKLHYIFLVLIYGAAHLLLPFNTSITYDDSHLLWMLSNELETLYTAQSQYGNIPIYYFDRFFGFFSNPAFAFKLTVFLGNGITSILIYKILKITKFFKSSEAFIIAAMASVYPAYMVPMVFNIAFHSSSNLAFFVAVYVTLRSEGKGTKNILLFRVLSSIFFFLSFVTNSFLVIYFGFLFIYQLFLIKKFDTYLVDFKFILKRPELFVLPFVFWIGKQIFSPVWGPAIDYNTLGFHMSVLKGIGRHLQTGLSVVPYSTPAFGVPFLLFLGFFYYHRSALPTYEKARFRNLLLISVVLMLIAAFPYVVVGKSLGSAAMDDYNSRNALLLALPLSLFIFSFFRMILRPQVFTYAVLMSLVINFAMYRVLSYEAWQVEAIKQESVSLQIEKHPTVKELHVITFKDEYPSKFDQLFYWPGVHCALIFGDMSRFCFKGDGPKLYSAAELDFKGFQVNVQAKNFDPEASQGLVKIYKNHNLKDRDLFVKYYRLKFEQPEQLEGFLLSLSKIQVSQYYPNTER